MKRILLFVFCSLFSLTANAGVRSFPLNTPLPEKVFACREQMAAEAIAMLGAQNREDDINALGSTLIQTGTCALLFGLVTYKSQTSRVESEHGLFTVYEATIEGIPFPVWIPMKDWEHAQS